MKDDSIEGIYDTLKQCALVSKSAGGIGLAVSCIRATGSYIAGVSKMHIGIEIKHFCLIAEGALCISDEWHFQWAGSYVACLQ